MAWTWDELNKIEQKRRRYLDYEANIYKVLLKSHRGTMINYIFRDPLFWLTLAFFLAVRIYDSVKEVDDEDVIPDSNCTNIIGAFLSFILTFFVNQAISDHTESFNTSMRAKGKIIEMATVAGAVLPKKTATLLVRYMNAAHLVGYTCLSDNVYNRDNFFDPFNKEIQVLTEKELSRMDELDMTLKAAANVWEILIWAVQKIEEAKHVRDIDARTAGALRMIVLDFRCALSKLLNDEDEPSVSFFYFHMISFLCFVYLPLFATYYALEASLITTKFTVGDVVSFLVVFVQCCFVIGMRLLATKLMSPFGDSILSLSVITYVKAGWQASNQILDARCPEEISAKKGTPD